MLNVLDRSASVVRAGLIAAFFSLAVTSSAALADSEDPSSVPEAIESSDPPAEVPDGDGAVTDGPSDDQSATTDDSAAAAPEAPAEVVPAEKPENADAAPKADDTAAPATDAAEAAPQPATETPEAASTPAAPAGSGSEAPSQAADTTPASPAGASGGPPTSVPVDDYYAKRAAEILQEEKQGAIVKPHPLAAENPDHNVVVCEGGCSSGKNADIVFIEPKSARGPITAASMETTSSNGSGATAPDTTIVCVAGCYGNAPRVYNPVRTDNPAMASAQIGGWITTVSGSEEAAKTKPKAKSTANGGSGDWMARINREREAQSKSAH